MDVAIPIFDRITALDAVGPYEVLSRLPGTTVRFVAERPGEYRTENGQLALVADAALSEVRAPEIVVVPGGFGTRALLAGGPLVDWVRAVHQTSRWTTSVCTGSLVLAAAGVLTGLEATTHWAAMELLGSLGAVPVERRVVVVEEARVITAAGVSAGIDMALLLAARLAGERVAQAIQLSIEYDPQPPFNAGSLRTAPADVIELVRRAEAGGAATSPRPDRSAP
ncbi:MAG TPA: DJ-1/PfpI family protein [Candidatus Angelobacter sp.]|jgi:putative intracellular protease/amidase|nr:DJ-1/PfpI family protein [Candidatus Angelobacter sp.]